MTWNGNWLWIPDSRREGRPSLWRCAATLNTGWRRAHWPCSSCESGASVPSVGHSSTETFDDQSASNVARRRLTSFGSRVMRPTSRLVSYSAFRFQFGIAPPEQERRRYGSAPNQRWTGTEKIFFAFPHPIASVRVFIYV